MALLLYRGCEEACTAFRDWLAERGIAVKIHVFDAQVDPGRLPTLVKAARQRQPDVVVTWGTQTALAAFGPLGEVKLGTHFTDRPGVFMIVSQPVASRLISTTAPRRRNITGTQYLTEEGDQIDAARTLLSESGRPLSKVGVIYTPTEPNAQLNVAKLHAAAETRGITVIKRALPLNKDGEPNPEAIPALVAELASAGIDMIYQPADTVMNVNRHILGRSARGHGIPVFAAGEAPVRDGVAFAGLVYSYAAVGRKTAEIVARVLDGERPRDISVVAPGQPDLLFNAAVADDMGIVPPTDVIRFLRYTGDACSICGEGP
ncbi:ABC transporter substrate-binding protein [Caenispirillum salinarum]|uniref:ABC transporter substrate-binding protein n=1 Tax=Caenispirillum salinarum TaxID=859058 RepID=UPI00384FC301